MPTVLPALNVLGQALEPCSTSPRTGFLRDGLCQACSHDPGQHTVCVAVTAEFLAFSRQTGNDLSTPRPEYDFPGLKPGDRWCLCLARWVQALQARVAPPIVLAATHESVLEALSLETLVLHALDRPRPA
jgi:hypothetical protein